MGVVCANSVVALARMNFDAVIKLRNDNIIVARARVDRYVVGIVANANGIVAVARDYGRIFTAARHRAAAVANFVVAFESSYRGVVAVVGNKIVTCARVNRNVIAAHVDKPIVIVAARHSDRIAAAHSVRADAWKFCAAIIDRICAAVAVN